VFITEKVRNNVRRFSGNDFFVKRQGNEFFLVKREGNLWHPLYSDYSLDDRRESKSFPTPRSPDTKTKRNE
jgi:hypothetical protein